MVFKTFRPFFPTIEKTASFYAPYIDAYNKNLVKKIEVRSVHQVGSTVTNGYVSLDEIVISKGNSQARLGFDVKTTNGAHQTIRLVGEGFDLKEQSDGLQGYADNFKVERIDG